MRSEEIGAKISTIANKRLHRAGLPLCSPSEQVHSPSGATDPPQHMGGMHPHERPSSRQLHQFLPHLVRLKQGAQALEDLQSMGDVAPVRKRSSPRFHLPDGSAETARWASSTFLLPHPSVLSPGHWFAFPLAPRRLHLGAPTWASPSSLLSQASIRSCAFSFLTHHYFFHILFPSETQFLLSLE